MLFPGAFRCVLGLAQVGGGGLRGVGPRFGILRFYSPEQPFFDKTWRPGEVEPAD
ncbi:hypothetical protein [Streptomyces sp. NBC_00658]|uniref:hypothetical protein n=1 Tax=Streptomyces sp. NBC_00658 TaxID=2975800 RepID=UPI00324A0503